MASTHTPVEHLSPLLAHLPDYGIVICKLCKFAVQPNALSSHLLRHHIYRDKRRILLDQLADLKLLEPDEVPNPPIRVPSFPYLPVASGYQCSLPDCGHLCISHKRMSQHLREQHEGFPSIEFQRHTQQVYMQTFFKGNKVLYFEVDPGTGDSPATNEPPGPPGQPGQPVTYRFLNLYGVRADDALPPISTTSNGSSREKDSSANNGPRREEDFVTKNGSDRGEGPSITQHQMQDLMYLHHYTTCTGLSLTRGSESTNFWTHKVPLQASAQPFLMHGILGVAAFHQAWLASDQDEQKVHHLAGLRHQSAGLNIFRSIVDRPTAQTSTALSTFARLLGVQCCVEGLLEAQAQSSHPNGLADSRVVKILEFMLLLRGGLDLLLNMQGPNLSFTPLVPSAETLRGLGDLETPPEVFDGLTPWLANEVCARIAFGMGHMASSPDWPYRASSLDEVRHLVDLCLRASKLPGTQQINIEWAQNNIPSTSQLLENVDLLVREFMNSHGPAQTLYQSSHYSGHSSPCPVLVCYPHIPLAIYSGLKSLPSRLFALVPKQVSRDVKAFDQAMAALVSSFSRSYAADTAWARWNGIESWPRMLPDHFISMVEARSALALVLIAHWCILLSRQEESYWFWRGQSRRILDIVLANLDAEMQDFVRHSISEFL